MGEVGAVGHTREMTNMTENPEQPAADRDEIIQKRETVERRATTRSTDSGGRHTGLSWAWLLPLVVLVLLLVWYILSRGEPQPLEMPDIEAPNIEPPRTEQRIEIQVPDAPDVVTPEPGTEAPSQPQ